MKTREEVDALKRNWQRDPIWDIEDTEGFEEYRDELIEFHKKWSEKCEERWAKEERKRGGGPAFPVYAESRYGECNEHSSGWECEENGLNIRDYFAGQMLAGNFDWLLSYARVIRPSVVIKTHLFPCIAEVVYKLADAMLAEKKKYE